MAKGENDFYIDFQNKSEKNQTSNIVYKYINND